MESNSHRGLSRWLGVGLVCGGIFAGCGGGSSSPSTAPTSSPTTVPAVTASRYSAGANANVVGITTGADGEAWFSECPDNSGFGAIAHISLTGQISVYPLPDGAGACPAWLTLGADHAVWFTEQQSSGSGTFQSQLGRIDSMGAITEYPLPASDSMPYGIATGGDGNIWYDATTQSGGTSVGVVRGFSPNTHTVIASANVPSASNLTSTANSLLQNPGDGSLLLIDGLVTRVVPGTTPTVAPAFTLPSGVRCFYGASGPDGNLYFQCSGSILAKVSESSYNVTVIQEQTSLDFGSNTTTVALLGPLEPGTDGTLYIWGSTGSNHPGPGAFATASAGTLEAYFDDTNSPHDQPIDMTITSDGAVWTTVSNGGTTAGVGAVVRLTPI